jgi:hypothetical protein
MHKSGYILSSVRHVPCPISSARVQLLVATISVPKRGPYVGDAKRLAAAIDIGTTFTAVSFCLLSPGEEQQFNQARTPWVAVGRAD